MIFDFKLNVLLIIILSFADFSKIERERLTGTLHTVLVSKLGLLGPHSWRMIADRHKDWLSIFDNSLDRALVQRVAFVEYETIMVSLTCGALGLLTHSMALARVDPMHA